MKIGFSKVGKNLLIGAKGVRSKSSMDLKKFTNNAEIKDWELRKIAQLVRDKIEDNIFKARSYKGGKLRKLATSTIANKGSNAILYDTGQLQNSIKAKKSGKAYVVSVSDKNYKHPNRSARTGKRLNYKPRPIKISEIAAYLQYGGGTLPARPFFGITNKDMQAIIKQVLSRRRSTVKRFI